MKRPRRALLTAVGVSALAAPALGELRIKRAVRPPSDRWQRAPVEPRRSTLLGLSFRPLQAEALGLDPRATLETLLTYPFPLIRLGAYWNRIEPVPGQFCPDELDRQVDAAAQAGKQIILCVGAVKTFGYPEFFVPRHHLPQPLREGRLVEPADHRPLLSAASAFISRLVERYRGHQSIVAWQVEHEAVDPLGVEHSWRLALDFVWEEIQAVRSADPTRPIMMNGFLPTSLLVAAQQWWRTRDQGDSLSVATLLADIVGVDFYPRHALLSVGPWSAYLAGSKSPWQQWRRRRLVPQARRHGARVMVAEGQAEPWEAVTTPPNPTAGAMYSCLPEQVIQNYNQCMRWQSDGNLSLYAYLFWGAEYWVLRQQGGDSRYLRAFERVLAHA
jgi:hypothetical protein